MASPPASLNPSAWLPELQLTVGKLHSVTAAVVAGSTADLLLRAVQATLTDAAQARATLTGRALFDALEQRCNGQLAAWLGTLTLHPEVTDPHPWPGGLDITAHCRRGSLQHFRRWSCRSSGGRSPESWSAGNGAVTGTAACASGPLGAARRWRSI